MNWGPLGTYHLPGEYEQPVQKTPTHSIVAFVRLVKKTLNGRQGSNNPYTALIAYTCLNALPDEQWKCDMTLELTDCMYGFSNCGLSYEEAKYCLCHTASDWML